MCTSICDSIVPSWFDFEKFEWKTEKHLNTPDKLPIIQNVTGALRILAGVIQTLSFSIPALVCKIGQECSKSEDDKAYYTKWCKRFTNQTLNGLANIGRGTIAQVMGLSTIIFIWWDPDQIGKEFHRGRRVKYIHEEDYHLGLVTGLPPSA